MSSWKCEACKNGMVLAEQDAAGLVGAENKHCPRFLECGHVFCTQCLEEMVVTVLDDRGAGSNAVGVVVCTIDQTQTEIDLSQGGVSALPQHLVLVEQHRASSMCASDCEPSPTTQAFIEPQICEACDQPHKATHFCRDCKQFMCGAMASAHMRIRATVRHDVVSQDRTQHPNASNIGHSNVGAEEELCPDHPQKVCGLYDTVCERMVCMLCIIPRSGKHSQHACVEPQQIVQEVEEMTEQARSGLRRLTRMQHGMQKASARVAEMPDATRRNITKYFDQAREILNAKEKELIEELKIVVKEKQLELHDQGQCISNVLASLQYVIDTCAIRRTTTMRDVICARDRVQAAVTHVNKIAMQQQSDSSPQGGGGGVRGYSYLKVPPSWAVRAELSQDALENIRGILSKATFVSCDAVGDEYDESSDENESGHDQAQDATNNGSGAHNEGNDKLDQVRSAVNAVLRRLRKEEVTEQQAGTEVNNILKKRSLTEFKFTIRARSRGFGDKGAAAIAEAIKSNKLLTSLALPASGIGHVGATAIAGALNPNFPLQTLYLDKNQIGLAGAAAISDALKSSALTTLSLHATRISNEGAKVVAQALLSNPPLTTLWLSANYIGPVGAEAVAEALKTNSILTSLYCNHNNAGDQGGRAFVNALKMNRTIMNFSLKNNQVHPNLEKTIESEMQGRCEGH